MTSKSRGNTRLTVELEVMSWSRQRSLTSYIARIFTRDVLTTRKGELRSLMVRKVSMTLRRMARSTVLASTDTCWRMRKPFGRV